MVEREFREHWDRLVFRDQLIAHPDVARRYQELKRELSRQYPTDRVRYTRGKSEFIEHAMVEALRTGRSRTRESG
jgi:GrpB-like predicted nucleotidyltransferase (UPF0157 family)